MVFLNPLYFIQVNWEMIGALGEWAGAIGTVWAVKVALDTSRLSIMPRIRVRSRIQVIQSDVTYYFELLNVGMIDVYVEDFKLRPKWRFNYLNIDFFPFEPRVLKSMDNYEFGIGDFDIIQELVKLNIKGKKRVYFYFIDSEGSKYKGSFKLKVPKSIPERKLDPEHEP
jgi:hypothetical protein